MTAENHRSVPTASYGVLQRNENLIAAVFVSERALVIYFEAKPSMESRHD
jgi:hypothetical protein